MTVEWVKEEPGRSIETTREGERAYERRFLVKTDTRKETRSNLLAATVNPWDQHPEDTLAFATNPRIDQDEEAPFFWRVVAPYTNRIDPAQEQPDDPIQWEIEIDWQSKLVPVRAAKDKAGDPIVNTAGDPVLVEGERSVWIANLVGNFTSVPQWAMDLNGQQNDADVVVDGRTLAAGTARFLGLKIGKVQYLNGTAFRQVSWQIHHDKQGFAVETPNVGYNELVDDGAGGTTRRPILIDGERPNEPQPLDADGKAIEKPDETNIVILDIDWVDETDLTQIPGVTAA